jgi:hypothetical protein
MTSLRLLLALLISLALPAQALADAMSMAACCPMSEAAASVEIAGATHDCCHDEDEQGTRCASDLSCKCGGHPAISTRAFVPPLPAVFPTHATAPIWPQSVLPVALWRPPTPPGPLG